MDREKGAETGTTTCPTCGDELELLPQPDGAVAAETCPKCFGGEPESKPAAEQSPPPAVNPPLSTPPGFDADDEENR